MVLRPRHQKNGLKTKIGLKDCITGVDCRDKPASFLILFLENELNGIASAFEWLDW